MNGKRITIVRHQAPLRTVGEAEAVAGLGGAVAGMLLTDWEIDSRPLNFDVEGGYWRSSDHWVRREASRLRDHVNESGAALHYFGLPEVPHVVGLGAHVGDEIAVHVHDQFATEVGDTSWAFPLTERTLEMQYSPLPREVVRQPGVAVLVVEVSFAIDEELVNALVGPDVLAKVRVTLAGGARPRPRIVQSAADVMEIREKVRTAIASIREARPGTELIHLFVAAPPSVCFAVGQELQLRNGIDVRTYRYRAADGAEPYKPALLLTSRGVANAPRPLTDAQVALAADLRAVCREALEDVKAHAARLPTEGPWYAGLEPAGTLADIEPFPTIEPLAKIVKAHDSFSDEPREEDYEFSKESRAWRMSDRLILDLFSAAKEDREVMRQLVRLFFYHEYLHDWHGLTKHTAEDVGSFANCLEAIDYMADTYALLHQLDHAIRSGVAEVATDIAQQKFVKDQIALAIASFWAFEPEPPEYEWQERRLRRYLNWYWRRVQMRSADDLHAALRTLVRQPHIEVAGLQYTTGRGRQFVILNKTRPGDLLEIGLVTEKGGFWRTGSQTALNIELAMRAFGERNLTEIDSFFNSLYELVSPTGAAIAPVVIPTRQALGE
jgi:hypothetical protein